MFSEDIVCVEFDTPSDPLYSLFELRDEVCWIINVQAHTRNLKDNISDLHAQVTGGKS